MFLPDYGPSGVALGLVLRLGSTVGHPSNSWASCHLYTVLSHRDQFSQFYFYFSTKTRNIFILWQWTL